VCNYLRPIRQVAFASEAPGPDGMMRGVMHLVLKPTSSPSAR
jgi:hypothetical protein